MIDTDSSVVSSADVVVYKANSHIELIQDAISIEFPSIEEIRKEKTIGLDRVSVKYNNSLEKEFVELLLYEKGNMEKKTSKYNTSDKFLYRMAVISERLGRREEAVKYAKKSSEISKDPLILSKTASILLKSGDLSGLQILSEVPNEVTSVTLALYYMQIGDFASAIDYAKKAYESYDFDEKINVTYAFLLLLKGDYRTTVSVLKDSILAGRSTAIVHYLLAICYMLLHQNRKSFIHAKVAYNLNKFNLDSVLIYSSLCENRGMTKEAIAILEKAVEHEKSDIRIWDKLSRNYFRVKKYSNAKNAISAILALSENEGWAWNNLALVENNISDSEKVKRLFLYAIKQSDDLTILLNYISFLNNKSEYETVIKVYEAIYSAKIMEKNEILEFRLFESYLFALRQMNLISKYESAILKFSIDESVGFKIKLTLMNYLICFYSTYKKDISLVNQYIEVAQDIVSNNSTSNQDRSKLINNIIYAYIENNNLDEAKGLILSLLARKHDNPYFNATCGLYYLRCGDWEKGEKYYEKAIFYAVESDLKTDIKRKRNLEFGRLAALEGNIERAKNYWKKAIGKDDYISVDAIKLLDEN